MEARVKRIITEIAAAVVCLTIGLGSFVAGVATTVAIKAAHAASNDLSTTSTPDTIYLFVASLPQIKDGPPYWEIYRTTDQKACDAQASDWSARLTPSKFACLPHAQKKLKEAKGVNVD